MKEYLIINMILFLIFGILLFYISLPILQKLKYSQNIRSAGPKSHYKKAGTPTMGGLIILINMLIYFSFLTVELKKVYHLNFNVLLLMLIPVLLYGIIGLIDDLLIIIKNNNDGIKPTLKFILQLIIAAFCYFFYLTIYNSNDINFFGTIVDIKFFYGILIIFLLVGVTNATNLTDGIDGLLGCCSIISFVSLGVVGIYKNELSVVILSFSFAVAILSFLLFNLPTAKIFMGNVGSLLIGAALVMECIILKIEILLIFFGFVYFVETLSVILQVWYFKKTKGQRLIKMSPLHHHLELSGFKEIEIDITFALIQFVMSVMGIWFAVVLF
jgi:phospho-N-acetylmuramoyl-pentapeptide-transferase